MSKIDKTFKYATLEILDSGEKYTNERRQVTRLQVPKIDLKHDFINGFPALSLKELDFKQVVGELIWFLRGDSHTKYLEENNINIWLEDTTNWYNKIEAENLTVKEFKTKIGSYDTGRSYPVQWRNWNNEIDQVQELVDGMIKDINGLRLIVNSWNASEVNKTALPPCHNYYQIIGGSKYGFYLSFNMRAWDWFLGAPFNIASYDILGQLLSLITGHKYRGVLATGHGTHLYENQIDLAKELVERDENKHPNCELVFSDRLKKLCADYNGDVDTIFQKMEISDFSLSNYSCDEKMRVKMLAPIKI